MSRPSPDSAALRLAFTRSEGRSQRRTDGTVSIEGRRFEIPNRYRHLERVAIRYAEWDLSQIHLVDERTEQVLCRLYPLDKERNASGLRRPLEPLASNAADLAAVTPATGLPPLLVQLMAKQAATGLPPPLRTSSNGSAGGCFALAGAELRSVASEGAMISRNLGGLGVSRASPLPSAPNRHRQPASVLALTPISAANSFSLSPLSRQRSMRLTHTSRASRAMPRRSSAAARRRQPRDSPNGYP